MNSFPCKQKFRSYPRCSPEEFQVKYSVIKNVLDTAKWN